MEAKFPLIVDSIYQQNLLQSIHLGGVNISEALSIASSKEHLTVKPRQKIVNKDRNEPICRSTFALPLTFFLWYGHPCFFGMVVLAFANPAGTSTRALIAVVSSTKHVQ